MPTTTTDPTMRPPAPGARTSLQMLDQAWAYFTPQTPLAPDFGRPELFQEHDAA